MPEELNSQPATEPEGGAPDGAATPPAAAPAPNGQEPQGGQQESEVTPVDGQEPKQGNPDNAEAAKWRRKLRDQETANADLQAKFDAMLQGLGKLAGQESGEASPEDQIAAAQAKADEYEQKIRDMTAQSTLKDTISGFKVDGKPVTLDPGLTLAVVRGTGALNDLDPASDDYPAQVARVVSETVEAHPQLKTQVVPKSSGNAPTPTENVSGKLTRDQVAALAAEGKWDEINEAAAAGRIA